MPKLGKILDLDKCYNDGKHWTHPELKEDKLYIVKNDGNWFLGRFTHWGPPYATFWQFTPVWGSSSMQLSYGKHPKKDGWKHIQEFLER